MKFLQYTVAGLVAANCLIAIVLAGQYTEAGHPIHITAGLFCGLSSVIGLATLLGPTWRE